jgi:hypothetical protein
MEHSDFGQTPDFDTYERVCALVIVGQLLSLSLYGALPYHTGYPTTNIHQHVPVVQVA